MVDIDEEVDQAGEEEEHRYVKKGGEGFDGTWKTESVHTLCEKGTYTGTFVGRVPRPGGLKISADPLLHERREERACQAQHKA
jgi:hypothetical protein